MGEIFSRYIALEILLSLVLGVALFGFITQILNFFIHINTPVALVFLLSGIALFFVFFRRLLCDVWILVSGALAFIAVAMLSFLSDSMFDSVNYHIQIVSWIQSSPVIFGLGNIHGRLGFNGLIYNFYALSDVSQIFPHLRSFIGNEVIYFGLLMGVFYTLLSRDFKRFSSLFLMCAMFIFPFILIGYEFRALYCEGIGAVIGVLVFYLCIIAFEMKCPKILLFAFIVAIFATQVKIANTALIAVVALSFIAFYKKDIFSKQSLRIYIFLGIFTLIFCAPWAIKGIMTSGMFAYPAPLGFIKSLSFAVSEEQRANEVCWIMSWARAPMQNCVEVLSSYAWMKDWFMMKTRYFNYFKHFIYALFASIALFVAFTIILNRFRVSKDSINIHSTDLFYVFGGAIIGICFWFFSGPDPRFGMVYIVPFFSLFYALNLTLLNVIIPACNKLTRYILYIAFILSVLPFFHNGRNAIVLVFAVLLLASFSLKSPKSHRIFLSIVLIALVLSIPNMFRKDFGGFKEIPKIREVYVEEKFTDSGLKVFVRRDKKDEANYAINYEAMPMTPYFNPNIIETRILGRKAYINTKKEKE